MNFILLLFLLPRNSCAPHFGPLALPRHTDARSVSLAFSRMAFARLRASRPKMILGRSFLLSTYCRRKSVLLASRAFDRATRFVVVRATRERTSYRLVISERTEKERAREPRCC